MMMDRFMQIVCFLFLSFLSLAAIDIIIPCYGNINVICMESEKQALLTFKKDLKDPSNRLSSWVADNDCCKWVGVVCNNSTGHVCELHLRGPIFDFGNYFSPFKYEVYLGSKLGGAINPSLLNLKHLSYLDLSQNNFGGLSIPSFMGSLVSLQYLNLSKAEFGGTIPNQLGNLSGLHSLGLGSSYSENTLNVENLQWLSALSSLEHLDLSNVNLNKTPNWLDMINMLPFLVELHLSNCQLDVFPPLLNVNFTSLAILDLSGNKFTLSSLISLNLGSNNFGGPIPDGRGNLTSLKVLDLSRNNFNSSIPRWIFTLSSLISLNLGSNNFGGPIPDGRGNLTSLKVLDLSGNNFNSSMLRWIFTLSSLISLDLGSNNFGGPIPYGQGNLTSLKVLDLSGNNFNSSMLRWIFTFSSLVSLDLRDNQFDTLPPSGPTNMTNLRYLDLFSCGINSTIPNWLYSFSRLETLNLGENYLHGKISSAIDNMTSITTLDLRFNELEGKVPREIGNLCNLRNLDLSFNKFEEQEVSELFETLSRCAVYSLKSLDLSWNQLSGHLPDDLEPFKNLSYLVLGGNSISGPIPESLGRLSSLEVLYLSENQLYGTLPESLEQLSKLEELDISDNYLEGVISEVDFAKLVGLRIVSASGNQFVLNVSSNWVPPFQLESLQLRSWPLGPQFPMWLQFMSKDMWSLDLSCTGISDEIPAWFWDFSSTMYYLNLSHNQIRGEIPNLPSVNQYGQTIDLGSNRFSGPLPLVSSNITELDLSNNSFSGGLSHFLCESKENPNKLAILQIGENHLSGEIPNCWMNWQSLRVIKLENNNLTGTIPNSMGLLGRLRSLHLRNNSLSGEVPLSLQNCTELVMLDISMNEFSGSIPKWNGTTLSNLIVLGLRSNKFLGNIPHELCNLPLLQILDMANNNLSGKIPGCFSKFEAMTIKQRSEEMISFYSAGIMVLENVVVVTKGRENQYDTILRLVTSMDLSNNNISGEIPEEITNLFGLRFLNLSGNHLTGMIPKTIGDMGSLESLDFSKNHLSSEIPPSMSKLNFLAYLNLSYNNLSGRIPSSTQLQSFNPSSYVGNKLCGPPVSENCSTDGLLTNNGSEGDNEGSKSELYWFYLTIALGFVVGFWGVWGPLLFNRQWRFAYFQFLENMWIKLLVLMRKCF